MAEMAEAASQQKKQKMRDIERRTTDRRPKTFLHLSVDRPTMKTRPGSRFCILMSGCVSPSLACRGLLHGAYIYKIYVYSNPTKLLH